MDKLREHIDSQELRQKDLYERFYSKNKDNEFLNDLSILRFRLYHNKELMKIFANNFYTEAFTGSR